METSKGIIIIQLFPEAAPITVANFKKLVNSGFYDGIIFHRVVKQFVIQAGDPTGTGYEGSKDKIKGEFAINGWNNPIHHERGVLSMARNSISYDSGSSQFFICLENSTNVSALDGAYAAFGKVIAGMDTVDAIAAANVDYNDKPVEDQIIVRAFLASVSKKAAEGSNN
ncbi:MAG: peptidylprolyl isomerase [Firmicutes bacterium]|nr:peptidylprolyl isomerase [Candidatus Colimorpha enterica]